MFTYIWHFMIDTSIFTDVYVVNNADIINIHELIEVNWID